jgi:hypothetical protein
MKVAEHDSSIRIQTTGVTTSRQFRMSAKRVAKSAQILGESLYNDRALAIIREYSTNAHDAHIMIGTPERPIHVTLPTSLSSVFKVRDFGPGIPESDIYNVYTAYFESTKEDEADMNGFLGLGSKAGFAYADTFTVTSVVDENRLLGAIEFVENTLIPRMREEGESAAALAEQEETLVAMYAAYDAIAGTDKRWKTIYTAYKNSQLIPCMDKQFEEATEEHTGVEVAIPIDEQRDRNAITNFNNTATNFYRTFLPRPVFFGNKTIDGAIDGFQKRTPLYEGMTPEGVRWAIHCSASHANGKGAAVMGNVAYPIDPLLWDAAKERLNRGLVDEGNLLLHFPTGMVVNHPSRESLDRSGQTVGALKRAVKRIMISLRKQVRAKMDGAQTRWEARVAYQRSAWMPQYLRAIALPKPLFGGKPIPMSLDSNELRRVIDGALGIDHEEADERMNALLRSLEAQYDGADEWLKAQNEIEKRLATLRSGFRMRQYGETQKYEVKKMPRFSDVGSITPNDNLLLVLGVTSEFPLTRINNYCRGAMRAAYSRSKDRVVVMVFPTREALEAFAAHEEIVGAPIIDLKDVRPVTTGGGGAYADDTAKLKARSKQFVFNRDADTYYQRVRSTSWEPAEIDLADGEGYYVLIEQYELSPSERHWETGWISASGYGRGYSNGNTSLQEMLTALEGCGITVPEKIYGFRSTMDRTKLGAGWKPFGDWVKQIVREKVAIANQQRANHDAANGVDNFYATLCEFAHDLPAGPLKTLVEALGEHLLPAGHAAFAIDKVKTKTQYRVYADVTVDANVDFDALVAAALAHYPMLHEVTHGLGVAAIKMPVWEGQTEAPVFDGEPRPAPLSRRKQKQADLVKEYQNKLTWHERDMIVHNRKVNDFEEKQRLHAEKIAKVEANRQRFLAYLAGFPTSN